MKSNLSHASDKIGRPRSNTRPNRKHRQLLDEIVLTLIPLERKAYDLHAVSTGRALRTAISQAADELGN